MGLAARCTPCWHLLSGVRTCVRVPGPWPPDRDRGVGVSVRPPRRAPLFPWLLLEPVSEDRVQTCLRASGRSPLRQQPRHPPSPCTLRAPPQPASQSPHCPVPARRPRRPGRARPVPPAPFLRLRPGKGGRPVAGLWGCPVPAAPRSPRPSRSLPRGEQGGPRDTSACARWRGDLGAALGVAGLGGRSSGASWRLGALQGAFAVRALLRRAPLPACTPGGGPSPFPVLRARSCRLRGPGPPRSSGSCSSPPREFPSPGGSGLSLSTVCSFVCSRRFLPVPPRCWVIGWDLAGLLSTCRRGPTRTEGVSRCRARCDGRKRGTVHTSGAGRHAGGAGSHAGAASPRGEAGRMGGTSGEGPGPRGAEAAPQEDGRCVSA